MKILQWKFWFTAISSVRSIIFFAWNWLIFAKWRSIHWESFSSFFKWPMGFNSCVLFVFFLSLRGCFSDFSTRRRSQTFKRIPKSPPKIWRRFFWANKKFFKIFLSEVWPEVSRKSIDLTNRPKLYELRQHPHTISFLGISGSL